MGKWWKHIMHQRQHVAAQGVQALAQEEQPVGHACQLQVLLGLGLRDAAIEEWQVRHGFRHCWTLWVQKRCRAIREPHLCMGVSSREELLCPGIHF